MRRKVSTVATVLTLIAAGITGCDFTPADPYPNEPPTTRLANIPVENDTLHALVTLHWDGADPDGFVVGFEYRYTTYYVFEGDSVETDWTFTERTSETIAFNSSDLMNRQRFEVRSVDNDDQRDPNPATRVFYTRQAIYPEAEIHFPADDQHFFAQNEITDWWRGIPLIFSAWDRDGEIEEYAYAVNDGDWIWGRDTLIYITPAEFGTSLDGSHTLRVTARNNTNLVNPEGDAVTVHLTVPRFDRRILIVDETDERNFPAAVGATSQDVKEFYRDLFATEDPNMWDEWDYYQQGGIPPREVLGRYQLVVWHADDRPTTRPHAFTEGPNVAVIQDYLNVGGDLIMSGWRMLKSFKWAEAFPQTFEEGTYVNDYLQINRVDETPVLADFTGAVGVSGFSNIRVDSDKLNFFPNFGTLNNINIITQRGGFTEVIYSYETSPDTRFPQYRGGVVGLIYFGTSFNAAVLGFPIFFIEKEDARVLANEILHRLGYE